MNTLRKTEANGPEFEGKVAIVTGGGAVEDGIGNGRAAAILLARGGAGVLVVDLNMKLAERTVEMIEDEGGKAAAFEADVTKAADCESMVAEAFRQVNSKNAEICNGVMPGRNGARWRAGGPWRALLAEILQAGWALSHPPPTGRRWQGTPGGTPPGSA